MGRVTARKVTPPAISALLRRAGFPRATAALNNGHAGYHVKGAVGVPGGVFVTHWTNTMADTRRSDREWLGKYADAIRAAGYRAELDEAKCLLTVTAEEED